MNQMEMLAHLKDLADDLEDRLDYATDTGESPWAGAGQQLGALQRAILVLGKEEVDERRNRICSISSGWHSRTTLY